MLVYIENKIILAKVLSLLDLCQISYTTNPKDHYDVLLITDIKNRTLKLMKNKKVFFFTNYVEEKILHHKFLVPNMPFKIITSLPLLKGNADTIFIPPILPVITLKKNKGIYEKYHLIKNKKRIIIFDEYLEFLKDLDYICENYSKYEIIYVGYKYMKKNFFPKNVIWLKYIDLRNYNDLCNVSDFVIFYSSPPIDYLYTTILTHTEIFMIEKNNYINYFIPSKHYYNFLNTNELITKVNKYLAGRTSSLNDNAYFLIEQNTEINYIQSLKKVLE